MHWPFVILFYFSYNWPFCAICLLDFFAGCRFWQSFTFFFITTRFIDINLPFLYMQNESGTIYVFLDCIFTSVVFV